MTLKYSFWKLLPNSWNDLGLLVLSVKESVREPNLEARIHNISCNMLQEINRHKKRIFKLLQWLSKKLTFSLVIMTSGYFSSIFFFYIALKWEVLNSLFPFFYQSSSNMSMLLHITMLPHYSCFFYFLTLCSSVRNWLLTFSWFHFQCYMDISTLKKKRYSTMNPSKPPKFYTRQSHKDHKW